MPGIQNSKSTLDYLGTIGTNDKEDILAGGNSFNAMIELAGFLIGEASDNLDKNGNVATGETASSMRALDIALVGTQYELPIEIASTYKFLDKGVRGVEGGKGLYAFKNKFVSAKMASAIKKWLRVRKVVTKYKAISKTERKNKRIAAIVKSKDGLLTGLSYAIAMNIKKRGIKPTGFFSKAIVATRKEQKEKYAKAFKLDIIESLNQLN